MVTFGKLTCAGITRGAAVGLRLPLIAGSYLFIAAIDEMWLVPFVVWNRYACPRYYPAGFRVSSSPISSRSGLPVKALFVGPAASPVTVEHGGELRCIEVSLSPGNAAIFGAEGGWPNVSPLNEVWQRAVAIRKRLWLDRLRGAARFEC